MPIGGVVGEGGVLLPPTTVPDGSRKRRRARPDASIFDDDGANSINPLFLVSGPRGGAITADSAATELAALADLVDDGVFHVLKDAWDGVAVPAHTYWSCPHRLYTGDSTSPLLQHEAAPSSKDAPPLRIPHPRQLLSSFYPVRVDALAARGYQPHTGLLPVALDRKGGKGSKAFNVLSRWDADGRSRAADKDAAEPLPPRTSAVAKFVRSIPRPTDRNLYVLVDEECPVDPYFDVDFSYSAAADDRARMAIFPSPNNTRDVTVLSPEMVETALLTILTTLRDEVERTWTTRVEECLVLTSSLQLGQRSSKTPASSSALEELKLSFHVHFRLGNRAAVKSVRELHGFMTALRAKLQRTQDGGVSGDNGEEVLRAGLLLACVDFGVYTRWRAFRLPYNVKAPESHTASPVAGGAGEDLLAEQLSHHGITVPDVSVGSVAPAVFQSATYAADTESQKEQRYLVGKLVLYFRFLLPLLPDATHFATAELGDFLRALTPKDVCEAAKQQTAAAAAAASSSSSSSHTDTLSPKDVVGAWAMEMASIVRDASVLPSTPAVDTAAPPQPQPSVAETELDATSGFHLLEWKAEVAEPTAEAAQSTRSPFDLPMPPMPHSVRKSVDDKETKKLLAEVFWCIAPEFRQTATSTGATLEAHQVPSTAITPSLIRAKYEESIRAYYVFQKQNKFCFRLQRTHKLTYGQLYLTFGSIKLRCYSNDCCQRCCTIPWEAPESATALPQQHAGYPKYERLTEIRNALFPPLPAGELVRRYGTAVLQRQA